MTITLPSWLITAIVAIIVLTLSGCAAGPQMTPTPEVQAIPPTTLPTATAVTMAEPSPTASAQTADDDGSEPGSAPARASDSQSQIISDLSGTNLDDIPGLDHPDPAANFPEQDWINFGFEGTDGITSILSKLRKQGYNFVVEDFSTYTGASSVEYDAAALQSPNLEPPLVYEIEEGSSTIHVPRSILDTQIYILDQDQTFLYNGPGTSYQKTGQLLHKGDSAKIVGASGSWREQKTWFKLELENGTVGWVQNDPYAESIIVGGGLDDIVIVDVPPPVAPTKTPVKDTALSSSLKEYCNYSGIA